MIRGFLGGVVVVDFFDQTFGSWVLECISFGGSIYVWFSGFVIVRITRLGWLGGWCCDFAPVLDGRVEPCFSYVHRLLWG